MNLSLLIVYVDKSIKTFIHVVEYFSVNKVCCKEMF